MGGGSSTVVKNRQDMVLDTAISASVPLLQAEDFEIKDLLQIGGMGRVYSGLRKSDNKSIALKFFGYTKRTQPEKEILREINLMQALVGINGVVQLLGVFFDTSEGLIPGKLTFEKFPVVVMELLAGGDLLEKIFENQVVSEKRLAAMFKGIILALKQIHERGFIHRDLKLENLMYVDEANAEIKLIDFGMMVQLKEGQDVYMSDGLQGTPGYLAPESIKNNEYSAATDMWQAGCCLYSILSGQMPFDDDFNQVTKGSYHKMSGTGWDNISRQAKNLVANILRKEKSERFGADDILKHPWIESAAPTEILSKDYYSRIKTLVLRRKLRKVFLEHNIEESNKLRRQSLVKALHRSGTSFRSNDTLARDRPDDGEGGAADPSQDAILESTDPNFGAKLYTLKRLVLAKLNPQYVDATADRERAASAGGDGDSSGVISLPPRKDAVLSVSPGTSFAEDPVSAAATVELNYEEFTEILISAGLTDLASAHVFSIFDIGGSGTIDIMEFLITLLAFKPRKKELVTPTAKSSVRDGDSADAARLYFDMFDIKDRGYIEREDLQFVIGCLLKDEMQSLSPEELISTRADIEILFGTICVNSEERISFKDFKKFYDACMMSTTKLRFTRESLSKIVRNRTSMNSIEYPPSGSTSAHTPGVSEK